MAAFVPKALEGREDTMWAHQGPLHSENIMHQLSCLWRRPGGQVMGLTPLGVENEDDKEGHLSPGRHSSSKMGQKRRE